MGIADSLHKPRDEPIIYAAPGTDKCEFGPMGEDCTVDGGYCFPAAAVVTVLRDGAPSNVTISQLALGDMVMVRYWSLPKLQHSSALSSACMKRCADSQDNLAKLRWMRALTQNLARNHTITLAATQSAPQPLASMVAGAINSCSWVNWLFHPHRLAMQIVYACLH